MKLAEDTLLHLSDPILRYPLRPSSLTLSILHGPDLVRFGSNPIQYIRRYRLCSVWCCCIELRCDNTQQSRTLTSICLRHPGKFSACKSFRIKPSPCLTGIQSLSLELHSSSKIGFSDCSGKAIYIVKHQSQTRWLQICRR